MHKTDNTKEIVILLVAIVMIVLGVVWNIYQYNLCMNLIGNTLYCLQHISN